MNILIANASSRRRILNLEKFRGLEVWRVPLLEMICLKRSLEISLTVKEEQP